LPGYIDMIGAVNAPDEEDSIDAYETGPLEGIKKHGSARRKNLTDTNNNEQDFEYIDYRTTETEEYEKEAYRPRNIAAGRWDPAAPATPPPPPPTTATLMILQAYGHGGKTDPAITHSFVELYNNTAAAIDLASYSLQIADEGNGTSWTAINLSGTIPSYGSYLIRGAVAEDISDSRLNLTPVTPDVDGTFLLSNDEFKIALMSNQTALTVGNPFDTGGGTSAAGYVDMLGAGKANDLTGYETAPVDGISKQRAVRRKHLSDTDNNADDFKTHDYRVSGLSDTDLAKCRPRTAAEGTWTPEFP
ncbi:MAG: lamin tail domain-containing protein, partial [Treponema sp.]|nr:lamin tail domain-containing protein [Treponema sp.]